MSTNDSVLAAAQRCLNDDPTASMAQIAAAAGIGRATLHRHYSSREALLHEIGSRSLDRWSQSMAAAGIDEVAASGDADRIRDCIDELIARYVDDLEGFGVALTDIAVMSAEDLRARCAELFEVEVGLYAAAQQVGVLRADASPRWVGHAVYGLLVAVQDGLRDGDLARRDGAAMVRRTLFDGLLVDGGDR
ncbi:TetR family transcriptional regulator [Nocardioides sambongensis]|uniref:TetR family transcriptional regulator n=1 Tax=Nocardioides sambongensis TaxID=2589074 RepID=UPI00112B0601|nr:TetR family transcriptional regulator [Nocardioides sambongensis]